MSHPQEVVKCDPDNSFVICPERKAAMSAGEFFYDFDRGRYFNEGPLPPMLFTEICPFCGAGLPTLTHNGGDGPE